jgi:hypothetical protein
MPIENARYPDIAIGRGGLITSLSHLECGVAKGGLALLFPAGARADVAAVEALSQTQRFASAACISSRRGLSDGWVELLAGGLTFDLSGLAPADAEPVPAPRHVFGLPRDIDPGGWEACLLSPGPHLAAAGAMEPVVRGMALLASVLGEGLGAEAICWMPAASWMDSTYFARIVDGWSSGGAFPALGFSGMERLSDGTIASEGLAFFTGQELRVEPRVGEAPADTVKLAVRLADRLVREGPIVEPGLLTGPDLESLFAEPSADGRQVRLRRQM